MQCIVVKSGEFENSYSLLYILLKSCLCCCSLATLAPQQQFRGQFQRFRTSFDFLCYTEKVLLKLFFGAVHTTSEFQLKHSRCNNGFSAGL